MAKKKQVGRRVEGWKAKSWFKVHVPDNLGKAYIGDTIANDADSVVGRIMQATLGEITNDYAKQHIKMSFKIATVTGDSAYTEFVGHEVTRDYLRSLVKRRSLPCGLPGTAPDKRPKESAADHKLLHVCPCQHYPGTRHTKGNHRINHRPGSGMGLNHTRQRYCIW